MRDLFIPVKFVAGILVSKFRCIPKERKRRENSPVCCFIQRSQNFTFWAATNPASGTSQVEW